MFTTLMLAAALLGFPDVAARDLDGRNVRTSELRGQPAVVALGFSYDSRRAVEPWTRWLVATTERKLPIIVMPVLGGVPELVRGFVDGAMARQTEAPLRRYVWTTTDKNGLVSGLGLTGADATVIALLDAQGQVRYVAKGAMTPAAQADFLKAWKAL